MIWHHVLRVRIEAGLIRSAVASVEVQAGVRQSVKLHFGGRERVVVGRRGVHAVVV